jgi:fructose-bisphosphate aldolase class II
MESHQTYYPTLKEVIYDALSRKVAIGHFNVSDSTQLFGIAEVSRELNVPVMVGVSEGEAAFFGRAHVASLVKSLQQEGYRIYLNSDHTKSEALVEESFRAGFDEVLFDGTKLPIEDNITRTRAVVEMARAMSMQSGHEILIEGELGYIGESSKVLDVLPDNLEKTTPEIAQRFVQETGIDLLAPAVGNVHGMLSTGVDPALDIELIQCISESVKIPLVLHGGSGTSNDDFIKAIDAGVAVVHINTEIRVAYRKGIELGLTDAHEVSPYKYLGKGKEAMKEVVKSRLALFSKLS